jgi:peroxiredoxin
VLLIALLGITSQCLAENATLTVFTEQERTTAHEFNIKNLAGEKVSLSAYKGKLVLLNFWATWCVPCLQEMPSMEKLWQRYREHGFVVLAISVGDVPQERVVKFTQKLAVTFPILLDLDDSAGSAYSVSSLPVSYIIDSDGVIIARAIGSLDWSDAKITRQIEQWLRP